MESTLVSLPLRQSGVMCTRGPDGNRRLREDRLRRRIRNRPQGSVEQVRRLARALAGAPNAETQTIMMGAGDH